MSSPANRERPPPVAASATSCDDDDMPHWASLHADLVRLVSWRVLAGDPLDYLSFRAVCTYWRSATVCPRGRGIVDPRFHPRRWMILPEGHRLHPDVDGRKSFLNLSTGAFVRPRLPLLMSHRVVSTVEGLLLLRQKHHPYQDEEFIIRLLHPFTGDVAELPPLTPLMARWGFRLKTLPPDSMTVCLSTSTDGVTTVMIVYLFLPQVLFATIGDKQWTFSSWSFWTVTRPISFQGKMYMLQWSESPHAQTQQILQIGPPRYEHGSNKSGSGSFSLPQPKVVATCPQGMCGPLDLAECDSEILVIGFDSAKHSTNMLVYRVDDLSKDMVLPVTNIGGNTILLDVGRRITANGCYRLPDPGRAITVSHKLMPIGDTIVRRHVRERYFGEYNLKPWLTHIGQYHLRSGTWTPTRNGCVPYVSPCLCGLIFHIYGNCCCDFRCCTGQIQPGLGWRR